MSVKTVYAGIQDFTDYVIIKNLTTGLPYTGLNAYNLSGFYIRERTQVSSFPLSLLTSGSAAFNGGGFYELSNILNPGLYRIDIHPAVLAPGADKAVVQFFGASGANVVPFAFEYQLVGYDPTNPLNLGISGIPTIVGATNNDIMSVSGRFNSISVSTSGLATTSDIASISGRFNTISASVSGWLGVAVNSLTSGNVPSIVNAYALGEIPLKGIVQNRPVDVTSSGTIGINWGNIQNQTANVNLTNTAISGVNYLGTITTSPNVNITGWLGLPPNSLIAGRVNSFLGATADNVITSGSIDSSAVTKLQTGLALASDIIVLSGKFNSLATSGQIMMISGYLPNLDVAVSTRLAPIVNGRKLDVTSSGTTAINWGNIENQSSPVNLINTAISGVNYLGTITTSPNVNITGWLGLPPNVLVNGKIDSYTSLIKDNLITSGTLDTTAITKIQNGLATSSDIAIISGKFSNLSVSVSGWLGLPVNSLISGNVPSNVKAYTLGEIPLRSIVETRKIDVTNSGTVGINWGNIENSAANVSLTNTSISGVNYLNITSSNNVNITGWLGLAPNSLVNGKIDSYTSLIKDNLITSGTLDSSAITKIQTGLAISSDIIILSGKFNNLSVNVSGWKGLSPNSLQTGRVDSYVGAMGTDTLDSNALATSAVTEIQTGLAKQSDIISISGIIQSPTGIVNANVISWLGSGVNSLISGYMPSMVMMYYSGQVPVKPTIETRTLDITANGNAGIDWANIDNPTTTVNLVNTSISGVTNLSLNNISVNVSGWRGLSPNVLNNGRVDSYVGAMATDVLDSNALATTAVTEIQTGLATSTQLMSISGVINNPTGIFAANVIQWKAGTVNSLTSGNVPVIVNAYASGELPLKGIVQTRAVDVTSSGTVGINWGNIENQSANINLVNTAISGVNYLGVVTSSNNVNVTGWLGLPPNVLKNGRLDGYVGSYGPNMMPLQSSITGLYLDVTSAGKVGVTGDFSNISVNVSGWKGLSPNVLVNGKVDSYNQDVLSLSGRFNTVSASVSGWLGITVNSLVSGNVPSIVNAYASGEVPLKGIVQNRAVDVTSSGTIGINWGNIENKTTVNRLTNTSISGVDFITSTSSSNVNITGWLGLPPNSLISGRVDSYVGMMGTDTLTAGALANSAVTEIQNGLAVASDIAVISGKFNNLSVNISGWQGLTPNNLVNGRVEGYVGGYDPNMSPLQPSITGRYLDVTSVGKVGATGDFPTNYATLAQIDSISGRFNLINANVSGWLGISPNSLVQGRVDSYTSLIKDNLITSGTIDSTAVTKIQSGLATTNNIMSISGVIHNPTGVIASNVIKWLHTGVSLSPYFYPVVDTNAIKDFDTGNFRSIGINSSNQVLSNIGMWSGSIINPLVSGNVPSITQAYTEQTQPLQSIVLGRKLDVSTSGYTGIFANLDKFNYNLSSSGLDFISIVSPTGVASNFREMNIQTWRRFFKKTTLNSASGIITFADDGSTIITRQPVSDNGTTQTQSSS